jgi:S-adenosylmethionine:tRNA ribosyltransferase-isomerase
MTLAPDILQFSLPTQLEASEPPEARGLSRDNVRLMVSHYQNDQIEHGTFRNIVHALNPGDVLVINTSGTLSAALPAQSAGHPDLKLHISTRLPANLWLVELRQIVGDHTKPYANAQPGMQVQLPGGGQASIHTPYQHGHKRLWVASLNLPQDLNSYLHAFGTPIRYSYVQHDWPCDYYQTVYASELGSAEMPSAGRAFTPELLTKLVAKGIIVVPLVLHTGVASLESHEPPYEEWYRVPSHTAAIINAARANHGRIVAVGTTVVRALETVTDQHGICHPGEGWTRLVISPERGLKVVNGLLTGFHEPQATHLAMLEALAPRQHLAHCYHTALDQHYLWHEFGDLHLLLP